MEARRPKTKAQAKLETREAMLEEGAKVLREMPVGDILSHVKAVDIAERAGKTTGAFYNIWKDQDEYRKDLIRHVLSPERFRVKFEIRQELDKRIQAPGVDLAELIRDMANKNFKGLEHEPYMALQLALWAKHSTNHDAVGEYVGSLYQGLNSELVPRFEVLLNAQGRRMRQPPYTVEHLAVVLMALIEGLHIRWAVDPGAVPDDLGAPPSGVEVSDQGPWGLFAAAAYALVLAMTEEVPPEAEEGTR
ncbi:TetR/AcrR family transcriptional regulator [Streptomyces tibetensis]|uniref:TetR/AcrR family transcriptional regulator n=1 Tax=Streptomyces tibetensis TaxID=2382123 RepID=A0ABW6N8Y0_9ACTN